MPIALGVGLALIVRFAVLYGLRLAWVFTIGYALTTLADILDFNISRFHVRLGGPVRRLSATINNWLHDELVREQHAMAAFFHGLAELNDRIGRAIGGLAYDVYDWGRTLQHVKVPRLTKALIIAAFPMPWLARRVAALVRAHAIPSTRTVIARTTRPIVQRVTRIVKATAGAVAIPGVFWHLFPRVRGLGRDLAGIRHRLRNLERVAGATAALALVATGLKRLGLRCLTGRNGRILGKRLCGVDPYLLQSVLTDATLIIGTISIVELTRGTQKLLPAITDATGYLVREAPAAWNDAPRDVIRDALAILPDFPG